MSYHHSRLSSLSENDVDTLENNNRDEPCLIDQQQVSVDVVAPSTPPAVHLLQVVKSPFKEARVPAKFKMPRATPNHFFALQITDCQILEAVRDVQNTIVEGEPRLRTALVPTSTLHITLAVAHLPCPQTVGLANRVLEDCVQQFSSRLTGSQLEIHLSQVGHFNNKVVYIGIEQDGVSHLNGLWNLLRQRCRSAGITLVDDQRFNPHVTLLKLSKDPQLGRKGIKVVASHLYHSHVDRVFGRQVIESVQLLSMTEPKDDRGYYALKGQFRFASSRQGSLECPDQTAHHQMVSAADVAAQAKDENRSKMSKDEQTPAGSQSNRGVATHNTVVG